MDSFRPGVDGPQTRRLYLSSFVIKAEEPEKCNGGGDNDDANIKPTCAPGEGEVNRGPREPDEQKHQGDGQQNSRFNYPVSGPIEA